MNVHRRLGLAHDLGEERAFLAVLSTRCMRKSGLPVWRMATTSPGKPAPEPRSSQSRASGRKAHSWAESAKCRRQRGAGWRADEVGGFLPMAKEIGVANQPVDCFTWNFKGFREILGARMGATPWPLDMVPLRRSSPPGPFSGGPGGAAARPGSCRRAAPPGRGLPGDAARASGEARSRGRGGAAKAKSAGMAMPSSLRKAAMSVSWRAR